MMKIGYLLAFVFLLLVGCHSPKKVANQTVGAVDSIFMKLDEQRQSLWKSKDYDKAIGVLKDLQATYQQLSSEQKPRYMGNIQSIYYNLACGYSLVQQTDSSLVYLQKAIDRGYSNYYWIQRDSDLVNIRNDKRYLAILENGDHELILKKNGHYKNELTPLPSVVYEEPRTDELKQLREKYGLEAVAGKGSEVSRIITLMSWVHKSVRHDGNSMNPSDRHADAMIQLCKKEKRGVNCRMMATILNEVYLSMGYPSRFVTCLPKDKNDNDCHVINAVFSRELDKWIWMDPSFETVVKDEKGNLLGIEEVRQRLVEGLPVFASPSINHNGEPYGGGGEEYLHSYMAKNLFQLQIPSVSCAAFESRQEMKSLKLQSSKPLEKFYIQLLPTEFSHENVAMGKIVDGVYYTNDTEQFWKKP